jgi:hypothetical protein
MHGRRRLGHAEEFINALQGYKSFRQILEPDDCKVDQIELWQVQQAEGVKH